MTSSLSPPTHPGTKRQKEKPGLDRINISLTVLIESSFMLEKGYFVTRNLRDSSTLNNKYPMNNARLLFKCCIQY